MREKRREKREKKEKGRKTRARGFRGGTLFLEVFFVVSHWGEVCWKSERAKKNDI